MTTNPSLLTFCLMRREKTFHEPKPLSGHVEPHCSPSSDHLPSCTTYIGSGPSSWAGFARYFSLLPGRAVSFHCVLVRIGRLVTGYLQRGQWGLSPVIQWKTGSLWWLCGSAWRRMQLAILADTLLPEDMVLLQTVISHRLLRDSLSA